MSVQYSRQLTTVAAYTPTLVLFLISMSIFLLTALLGVWIAYDRSAAIIRFDAIASALLASLLIAILARNNREVWLVWLSFGSVFLILGFSTAFWGKLGVNTGTVAEGLALLLPLGAVTTTWAWARDHRLLTWMLTAILALGVVTLVISADHSAILSFIVGFIGTLILYWRLGQSSDSWIGRLVDITGVIAVVMVLVFGWIFLTFPRSDEWISGTALGDALVNRFQLWRTAVPLIQDYQFTGSGLSSTAMVYSTYIVLLHVPFHYHVHNLYLQIGIEQGLPGLIGFLGIVGATFFGLTWQYRQAHPGLRLFSLATWMSSAVLVVYGMLDSEIYASRGVSFMFAPFGFALVLFLAPERKQPQLERADRSVRNQLRRSRASTAARPWYRSQGWLVGCLPAVIIVAFWFGPDARAAQQANWGAIAQTRAELLFYRWSKAPIQDAVRRNGADLTATLRYYHAALRLNPNNVTAHRRLGQIMLSQGKMEAAQRHLALAYAIAPNQLVTRQLLGEVYGVTGQIEEAAALWQTVPHENGQLNARYWWYNHLGAQTEAERIKQVIAQVSQ